MNNVEFAIMTKLHELLERHGIHPCGPVIALHNTPDGGSRLAFESPPQDQLQEQKMHRLMTELGLDGDTKSELKGTDIEV